MSTVIDERVVEMRFDNKQFEANAQQSMTTLEKLKSMLNFKESAKGLTAIQNASNSLNLSNINDAVDAVNNKFSLLGTIGDQVIRKLTDGFMNLGHQIVGVFKSVTTDQIGAGFQKYADYTTAVQTIVSATGKSVDEIEEQIEKLNWFTDETSYSLTDMTNNIGKFTSNGVELEDAVTSMIGIANAAGLAGSGVQNASHAMEGFSKAIAQGYMSRHNWSWIKTARIDTKQFKEILIDAGLKAGTLKKVNGEVVDSVKGLKVSYEDFETAMTHGKWLTSEVIQSGLAVFGKFSEELYDVQNALHMDTASELLGALEEFKAGTLNIDQFAQNAGVSTEELTKYLSHLTSEEYKFGEKSFRASQEAKTFAEAIDSVKDAVSTGWMTTFKHIFGNYDEAKKLWTDVAEGLYDIFAEGSWYRNEVFAQWHGEKRQTFIEAIAESFNALKEALAPIHDAFRDIFPKYTYEDLARVTDAFAKFAKALHPSEKTLGNLYGIFHAIFRVAKGVITVVKKILGIVFKLLSPVKTLLGILLDIAGAIAGFIDGVLDAIKGSELLRAAFAVFKGAIDVLATYISTWLKLTFNLAKSSPIFEKIKTWLKKIAGLAGGLALKGIIGLGQGVAFLVKNGIQLGKKVVPYIKKARTAIGNLYDTLAPIVKSYVSEFFGSMPKWFVDLKNTIVDFIRNFRLSDVFSAFHRVFERVAKLFKTVKDTVKTFFENLKNGKGVIESAKEAFKGLGDKFKDFKEKISDFLKEHGLADLFEKISEAGKNIPGMLSDIVSHIHDFLSSLTPGQIAGLAFVTILLTLASAVKTLLDSVSGLATGASGLVGTINKFLKKTLKSSPTFKQIAESVGILTASLIALAWANEKYDLRSALNILEELIGFYVALTAILMAFSGALNKMKFGTNFKTVGAGMIAMAGGILLMVVALAALGHVNLDNLLKKLLALAAIAGILGTVSIVFTRLSKGGSIKGAITIIALAASIWLVVDSLARISEMDLTALKDSVQTLVPIMVAMGVLAFAIGNIGFGTAVGLLLLIVVLKKCLPELREILNYDFSKFIDKIKENTELVYEIGGLVIAMSILAGLTGKGMKSFGTGIALMAVAVLILVNVIKQLAAMNPGDIKRGLKFIAGCFGMFAMLELLATFTSDSKMVKFSFSMIVLTGAIYLLLGVIKLLATFSKSELKRGLGALSVIMVLFALIEGLSALTANARIAPILAITLAIVALVGALTVLTMLDVGAMMAAAKAMSMVMLSLSVVLFTASKNKKGRFGSNLGSFIAAIGALVVIAGTLYLLARFNPQSLIGAAAAMAIVMVSLTIIVGIMSKLQIGADVTAKAVGFTIFALSLVPIAYALSQIAAFDFGKLMGAAAAISTVMLAMSGVIAILSLIPFPAGIAAIGLFDIFLASLIAVAVGIGALDEAFNGGVSDKLNHFGEMIGGFVGNIVASFGSTVAERLPKIGSDLSDFMENVQPFIDGASGIDDKLLTSVTNLCDALIKLTGASFLDGIASFLGGDISGFGAKLKVFGEEVGKFKDGLGTVKDEDVANVERFVKMAKPLADLAQIIPNSGGILGVFVGNNDIDDFGKKLTAFGIGVKKFAKATAEITDEHVDGAKRAVSIAQSIANVADTIPNSGGALADLVGDNDVGVFGNKIVSFGYALVVYSKAVSQITEGDVAGSDRAISIGQNLASLADALPNQGGKLGKWLGDNDIGTFGRNIADFGPNLKKYADSVMTIGGQHVTGASKAVLIAQRVAELSDSIPDYNGVVQMFSGEKDFGAFSEGLAAFGKSLVDFSTSVQNIKSDSVSAAIGSMTEVVNLLSGIQNGNIAQIASDFTTAFNNLGQANVDGFISAFKNAGGDLASAIKSFISEGTSGIKESDFSDKGRKIAVGLVQGFKLGAIGFTTAVKALVKSVSNALKNTSSIKMAGVNIAKSGVSGVRSYNAQWVQAGKDLIQGLINGINVKSAAAQIAAMKVARATLNAAKSGLQERSPSKATTQMGIWADEGLINGLMKLKGKVESTSENVGKGAIDGFQYAVNGITDAIQNDLDASPTITPVLDLSQIQNGASLMNSMLSGGSYGLSLAGMNASISNRSQTSIVDKLTGAVKTAVEEVSTKIMDTVGNQNVTIEVPLYMDGREVARVTAPYTRTEINKLDTRASRREGVA